jgi:hypothetical protein
MILRDISPQLVDRHSVLPDDGTGSLGVFSARGALVLVGGVAVLGAVEHAQVLGHFEVLSRRLTCQAVWMVCNGRCERGSSAATGSSACRHFLIEHFAGGGVFMRTRPAGSRVDVGWMLGRNVIVALDSGLGAAAG